MASRRAETAGDAVIRESSDGKVEDQQ